jgi:hypothetical protein
MGINKDRIITQAIYFPDGYRDNMESAVYTVEEAMVAMIPLRQYNAILQGETGYFRIVKVGKHIYKYTEDVKIFARKLGSLQASAAKSSGPELLQSNDILREIDNIFVSNGYTQPTKARGLSTSRKTGGITFNYWKEKDSKVPGCKWILSASILNYNVEKKDFDSIEMDIEFKTPEKSYLGREVDDTKVNGTYVFNDNMRRQWSGWSTDNIYKEFTVNFPGMPGKSPYTLNQIKEQIIKSWKTLSGLEDLFLIDITKKFNVDKEGILRAYFNTELEETITVPEGVTTIGTGVFKSTPLIKIILPKTLIKIEKNSFGSNNTLQQVVFNGETRQLNIGREAFESCSSLSEITFPNCPTTIENSAFNFCGNLKKLFIPKTVLNVDSNAFNLAGYGNAEPHKIYIEHPEKPGGWSDDWKSSWSGRESSYQIFWGAKFLPESYSGKPSKNDLKKAAKRHKKTDKKGARGWFTVLGSGDVNRNISRFNTRMSGGSGPQVTPSAAGYVAPASASSGGEGSAPGGLGEAIEEKYCLTEKVEKHETLNPKLWEGNILKPEVKEKILEIVNTFVKGLKEDGIKINIKDIVLIGSNASYNYSDTSDLDVHILVDTEKLECPDELYPLLYSSYRSIFNKKYDIEFYGTGVELFVDTEDTKTISNGIYSLNSGWIKEPVKEDIPELDEERFNAEFTKWEDMYFDLIKGENIDTDSKPIQDVSESLESDKTNEIDEFVEDLYDLRKISLQQEGEYSIGNLVFKEIRSLGYLDNLKSLKNELKSRELSLKENVIKESFGSKPMTTLEEVDKYAEAILKDKPEGVSADGTYDLDDKGNPVMLDLTSGFQVSFFRDEIREQGNEALKLVLDTIGNSFGQQYLGFFGNKPEISYTLEISLAKEVGRIFNQKSVWNNELQKEEPNTSYDDSKKVNYKEAVKELANLLGKTVK